MKKFALLSSLVALLSHQAISDEIRRDFALVHEKSSSCTIEVENNFIEGNSLNLNQSYSADLLFNCTDLDRARVEIKSLRGGLQKIARTDQRIPYQAMLTAEHLEPSPLIDTQTSSSLSSAGIFFINEVKPSLRGTLSVTLKTPDFTPSLGRYQDVLTVTLSPRPASI